MAQESQSPVEAAREMGEQRGPIRDWDGYIQTAEYANNVLPELRRLAGFDDPLGVGTYTSCPSPEAGGLHGELIDAFQEAAVDV